MSGCPQKDGGKAPEMPPGGVADMDSKRNAATTWPDQVTCDPPITRIAFSPDPFGSISNVMSIPPSAWSSHK
jgi:hypothetical protein